jgi:Ca2+-binding RTX toxin-like protein
MIGGAGDDIYYADIASDVVVEASGAGIDTVFVTFSGYHLASTLENLTLAPWASAIDGWGNDANNTITGNASANIIFGEGGADRLMGGGGSDQFAYDTHTDSTVNAMDVVADFASGSDRVNLHAFGLANHNIANTTVGSFQGNSNATGFFSSNAVIVQHVGDQARIYADLNANGNFDTGADLVVHLSGINTSMTAGDFVF